MTKIRTFVAVKAGPEVRAGAELLIGELCGSPADVKWVEPENLHLTVKFLGDVVAEGTPRVCEAVQGAVAGLAPFELEIRGAGAFPSVGRPGTVWLGTGRGSEQMEALFRPIDKALQKLGFPRESRRFHAHLTLGRVRRGGPGVRELGELIRRQADFEAGSMTVGEATIFSSVLRPEGPTYQILATARLSGD
jgi:2'-5' RNA ligase